MLLVVTGCGDETSEPQPTTTPAPDAAAPTKEGTTLAEPALGADDVSYWDGSAAEGPDGRYHLFASRMTNGCGLESWLHNSEVVHATADEPEGPYEVDAEPIVEAFAHNPKVVADPEGGWVLYTIGEPVPAEEQVHECENGATQGETPQGLFPRNCVVNVQHADELEGPWTERQVVMDASWNKLCPTNPAPVIHDDGSVSLVYRAYDFALAVDGNYEFLYAAEADRWDGEYRPVGDGPIVDVPAEDPTLWESDDGFHLLFNQKFTEPERIGGAAHGPSLTDLEPADPLYSLELRRDDGATVDVVRRERPALIRTGPERWILLTAVEPSEDTDRTELVATEVTG
ncbi:MAG: glycoside hydrolase family protein [Microthrixaceae bacterium]|nr:glycoside hydrolase family protein [Microthrixaceae bacterium]